MLRAVLATPLIVGALVLGAPAAADAAPFGWVVVQPSTELPDTMTIDTALARALAGESDPVTIFSDVPSAGDDLAVTTPEDIDALEARFPVDLAGPDDRRIVAKVDQLFIVIDEFRSRSPLAVSFMLVDDLSYSMYRVNPPVADSFIEFSAFVPLAHSYCGVSSNISYYVEWQDNSASFHTGIGRETHSC